MPPKPKTLSDFKAVHDLNVVVPAKITAALTAMEKEHPESWEYEGDFIRRSGISTTQMGQFRSQFEKYIVETSGRNPKRVWFATEKAAKAARGA